MKVNTITKYGTDKYSQYRWKQKYVCGHTRLITVMCHSYTIEFLRKECNLLKKQLCPKCKLAKIT